MFNLPTQSQRMLMQVQLQPVQGVRFGPTDFPDLGAAELLLPNGALALLVESNQSMANRLEAAIWDDPRDDLVKELHGMPYVRLQHPEFGLLTSLTEAHRLASPYFEDQVHPVLALTKGVSRPCKLAPILLHHDPNSLIHGVFFPSKMVRLPRLLSAFVEAHGVSVAQSGGVKFDHANPSGEAESRRGHIPYSRREYMADQITAFFNLDLQMLSSFALSDTATRFLAGLSLLKIRRFLSTGLRLRTACDLAIVSISGYDLPSHEELAQSVAADIATLAATGEFRAPAIWQLEP